MIKLLCNPNFTELKDSSMIWLLTAAFTKHLDQLELEDMIQVFDAAHKFQISGKFDKPIFDKIAEYFMDELHPDVLQGVPLSSVLRLHRAACHIKSGFSEANQTRLRNNLEYFLTMIETQEQLTPMMWLSIQDACGRTGNQEMV